MLRQHLGSAEPSQHGMSLHLAEGLALGVRAFTLRGPCKWLERNVTLLYRGVPIHAASPHAGDCSTMLSELAADVIYDGCVDLPVVRSMPVLDLALATIPLSALAPTPAFNLDDHFQLLNALVHAASRVPEPAAHAVEVGSFAGHTTLLQAAALRELGLNRSQTHSVEMEAKFGMPEAMRHVAQQGLHAKWHHTTVGKMPEWQRPLRLFFEDSAHVWQVTNQSFAHFESHVVEGGLVVMHDVGCCAAEYNNNWQYLNSRVFRRKDAYGEIKVDTPTWDWLNSSNRAAYQTLRHALIQSADCWNL